MNKCWTYLKYSKCWYKFFYLFIYRTNLPSKNLEYFISDLFSEEKEKDSYSYYICLNKYLNCDSWK